jgi:hypothetical protein
MKKKERKREKKYKRKSRTMMGTAVVSSTLMARPKSSLSDWSAGMAVKITLRHLDIAQYTIIYL